MQRAETAAARLLQACPPPPLHLPKKPAFTVFPENKTVDILEHFYWFDP